MKMRFHHCIKAYTVAGGFDLPDDPGIRQQRKISVNGSKTDPWQAGMNELKQFIRGGMRLCFAQFIVNNAPLDRIALFHFFSIEIVTEVFYITTGEKSSSCLKNHGIFGRIRLRNATPARISRIAANAKAGYHSRALTRTSSERTVFSMESMSCMAAAMPFASAAR